VDEAAGLGALLGGEAGVDAAQAGGDGAGGAGLALDDRHEIVGQNTVAAKVAEALGRTFHFGEGAVMGVEQQLVAIPVEAQGAAVAADGGSAGGAVMLRV